jgi:hypothetical protein
MNPVKNISDLWMDLKACVVRSRLGEVETGRSRQCRYTDRDEFRGGPGSLHRKMTGTTPAQRKPVPRARPMDAKRTSGLWTPAALGERLCAEQRLDFVDDVCGGLRRRQASRATRGFEEAEPPAALLAASRGFATASICLSGGCDDGAYPSTKDRDALGMSRP